MNNVIVKSNLKEMKQNLEKKRDELWEGNSLGVPKSTVLVGKLFWQPKRGRLKEQEKQKGLWTNRCFDLKFFTANEEWKRRKDNNDNKRRDVFISSSLYCWLFIALSAFHLTAWNYF